jgi:signal transduction histidine kinase
MPLGTFLGVVHEGDRDRVRAEFERCLREGGEIDTEFRAKWPDGSERWLKDRGKAFPGPDGRPLFLAGAAVDITGRKQTEEELRRARDELEERVRQRTAELVLSQERALQVERLAVIGHTVTALAHEGRNALQRASGTLERLGWRLEGRPEEAELAGRIRNALGDLERLFDDVRSYAAPTRLEYQPCDLGAVWREAWARQFGPAQRHAQLVEGAVPADLSCEADPFRLGQVFGNLFANALEARPDRVRVTIRCEEAELAGRPALRVSVRDNGPGFPEEQRRLAFEPFRSTKPKGTGLGLAIVKRLVEAHGGEVFLGPSAGGAEVVVTLPRKKG